MKLPSLLNVEHFIPPQQLWKHYLKHHPIYPSSSNTNPAIAYIIFCHHMLTNNINLPILTHLIPILYIHQCCCLSDLLYPICCHTAWTHHFKTSLHCLFTSFTSTNAAGHLIYCIWFAVIAKNYWYTVSWMDCCIVACLSQFI